MMYFIRHAQSLANIGGTTSDATQIPLTELGWQQAHALLDRFAQVDRIIISPYLRTRHTAQPLLDRTSLIPEVWQIQEFNYLSSVKYANTSVAERKHIVDAYWQNKDIEYCDGDDAESFADFYRRTQHMLIRCQALHQQAPEQTILVFTHGRVMQLLRLLLINPPPLSRALMQDFLSLEKQEKIWNTRVVALDEWQATHSLD